MRDGINLPLLGGGFKTVDAPVLRERKANAGRIFEDGSNAIGDEWVIRKEKQDTKQANIWLQTHCYHYLAIIITNGLSSLFEERIIRLGREDRGISKASVNPFQRGLLALFAHDKGYFDGDDRDYFGKRFWYAYRHYVPAEFIVGFLHQYYKDSADQRKITTSVAPELAKWIWTTRAQDERPELRGKYPAEIETKVHLYKNIAVPIIEYEARATKARASRAQQEIKPDNC